MIDLLVAAAAGAGVVVAGYIIWELKHTRGWTQ